MLKKSSVILAEKSSVYSDTENSRKDAQDLLNDIYRHLLLNEENRQHRRGKRVR